MQCREVNFLLLFVPDVPGGSAERHTHVTSMPATVSDVG